MNSTSDDDSQRRNSLNQDSPINNYEESSENIDERTKHKDILGASLNYSKELIDIIYNDIKSSMQTYIKPKTSTKIMTYNQDSICNVSKISSEFKSITCFRRYLINKNRMAIIKTDLDYFWHIFRKKLKANNRYYKKFQRYYL